MWADYGVTSFEGPGDKGMAHKELSLAGSSREGGRTPRGLVLESYLPFLGGIMGTP